MDASEARPWALLGLPSDGIRFESIGITKDVLNCGFDELDGDGKRVYQTRSNLRTKLRVVSQRRNRALCKHHKLQKRVKKGTEMLERYDTKALKLWLEQEVTQECQKYRDARGVMVGHRWGNGTGNTCIKYLILRADDEFDGDGKRAYLTRSKMRAKLEGVPAGRFCARKKRRMLQSHMVVATKKLEDFETENKLWLQ